MKMMKIKNLYAIVVVLLLAAFCSSCVVDGCEDKGKVTQKGMAIYNYYQFNTFLFIKDYADWGFKLNAWLALPDSARRDVELKYFPNVRIYKESAGVYGLYENAKLIYTIDTKGRALSDVEADWTISWKNALTGNYGVAQTESFIEGNHELHIRHVPDAARNAWRITLADADSVHSYIDIVVEPEGGGEYIAESLFEWSFSITGSGCYSFREKVWDNQKVRDNNTYLQFKIEESMPWICNYDVIRSMLDYETYHFRGGKVALNAINDKNESISVYAEFKGFYDVAITYKDVTELWHVDMDYYR